MNDTTLIGMTLDELKEMWGQQVRPVDNVLRDNHYTKVYVLDHPGAGNACHVYVVLNLQTNKVMDEVYFQNGPIRENGVNGIHNEDLLAIVRHRLQGFQSGEYACRENALALTNVEQGTMWLNKRTGDRERRNVEGTSEK